jgi:hypothetical protein
MKVTKNKIESEYEEFIRLHKGIPFKVVFNPSTGKLLEVESDNDNVLNFAKSKGLV